MVTKTTKKLRKLSVEERALEVKESVKRIKERCRMKLRKAILFMK